MLRSRCAPLLIIPLALTWICSGCGTNSEPQRTSASSRRPSASQKDAFSTRYAAAPDPVPVDAQLRGRPELEAVTDEGRGFNLPAAPTPAENPANGTGPQSRGDQYAHLPESQFVSVKDQPLSTFSIDVDTASYSKTRMFLMQENRLPPLDAVRIEEFVNYFEYDYAAPTNGDPFAMHIEVADCPWRPAHRLARVALKGRQVEEERPACNLVFLIDVSGSMASNEKIGLVKQSLRMLTPQLTRRDSVAIAVYASSEGLVLPATPGDRHAEILAALDRLEAGGATNGGAGIRLAYSLAKSNLVTKGINRVILCTDGDFNVGTTNPGELVRLAQEEAKAGIFLTVLGFGMGNHNDALLEEISNKANGAYAFIDNLSEGRKVFVDQLQSTLITIAKDVKIQIEFNPATVAAYRLIGYENRLLQAQDFNDDRKDAGEVGAGHAVTALYELVPPGVKTTFEIPSVDPLRYRKQEGSPNGVSDELFTLKVRYKEPDGERSRLLTQTAPASATRFSDASTDFRFATSVAGFGMWLRKSEWLGDLNLDAVTEIASSSRGADPRGYRREFLELLAAARRMEAQQPPANSAVEHVTPPASSYTPPTSVVVHTYSSPRSSPFSVLSIAGMLFLFGNLVAMTTIIIVLALYAGRGKRCVTKRA